MSNLKVTGTGTGYTLISNVFIDRYMITSGSSHLKTYLLLVRLLSDPEKEISVSGMADILDCSESDVLRSLRHWEKKGLMKLHYTSDGKILSGIVMIEPKEISSAASGQMSEETITGASLMPAETQMCMSQLSGEMQSGVSRSSGGARTDTNRISGGTRSDIQSEDVLPPRQTDLAEVSKDESFSRLLFIAEQYIGSTLSRSDCETFAWLYDGLKMETAILEYLVEYCVSNGHRSVRYMEAVAIDWHQKKIKTVEQARVYTPLHNKNLYAVMKALGLNDRQPTPHERKIIDNWFQGYGFSLDMVIEACNRTMLSIHKPSLNYVESILSRWKEAGISSLAEVQGLDEQFQKQKENEKNAGNKNGADSGQAGSASSGSASKKGKSGYRVSAGKPGASFHDFEQRHYDYDELLKQINSSK